MRRIPTFLILTLAMSTSLLTPAAWAQDQTIEVAALRCSAISLVHSPLTVPTPQFGELMTQFAGLFAQVHMLHKSERTKAKVNPHDFVAQRVDHRDAGGGAGARQKCCRQAPEQGQRSHDACGC